MNAPEEVPLPTPFPPFPGPDVTDITPAQHRQNNVTAAVRRSVVADAEADIALATLEALNPTAAEIRAALATWKIN